ncbi:MAG TPA: alpha/beta hydrolase, partial [Arachnia sp.]|nr:alpha/beta hydrolase [Arachnia sp.]
MRSFTVTMNPSRNVTLEAICFDLPSPEEQPTPLEHPRPAMVICPGGGYRFLSQREADPVAASYLAHGFNAFILRYSIREHAKGLAPAIDAARAVRWVRAHAEELGVDPERVAIVGFSAGGHVAAQLATHWQDDELVAAERSEYAALRFLGIEANDGLLAQPSRPDALIASYAVLGTGWETDEDPALTYLD